MPLRCVIVDDSPSLLEAARSLLEQGGIDVVGVASTGVEALRQICELRPDVALVDIDLGSESGFEVVREIAGNGVAGSTWTILISTHAEADFADLIATSPAVGFLAKSELSAERVREMLDR
jgi:DNA-binding NarL/FixJ family response regulator